MQLNFLFPLKRPTNPNFFFFLKLGPNTRILAKNQKNRTTLRVSTKRPKIGYIERKKSTIKINKVRQKCQFLIFFNEIFTVYAASDGEYEKMVTGGPNGYPWPLGPVGQLSVQKYTMLYQSNIFFKEILYWSIRKKIKWVTFCLWKPW
jgi:hypothetical protein